MPTATDWNSYLRLRLELLQHPITTQSETEQP